MLCVCEEKSPPPEKKPGVNATACMQQAPGGKAGSLPQPPGLPLLSPQLYLWKKPLLGKIRFWKVAPGLGGLLYTAHVRQGGRGTQVTKCVSAAVRSCSHCLERCQQTETASVRVFCSFSSPNNNLVTRGRTGLEEEEGECRLPLLLNISRMLCGVFVLAVQH